jgi:cytochrome c-type biogenesis protein CcmH
MMGWLILFGLALLASLLLWRPGRLDRSALMLVGAALCVAAAGYAWQGRPGEAGAPAAGREKPRRVDTLFAAERQQVLNAYGETGTVLGTADAFNRMGEDQVAVGLLRNAVIKRPKDVDLRIGYAHALLVVAQSNFTPAVQLAFDRADAIAKPGNPAPLYFRGLAQLESGDPSAAERTWRALYATLPADSRWRQPMERRLAAFDMIRAIRAREAAPR